MRYISATALGFVLIFAGTPAFAQVSTSGDGNGFGGIGGAPKLRPRVPDIAPPALPGAENAPLATGPVLQQPAIADPTTALFAAINSGDYSAAQDAISRGADMNTKNVFGETPLDLAVALNQSSIIFMLLSARNETSGGVVPPEPAAMSAPAEQATHRRLSITPATDTMAAHKTVPAMGNNPGTPDPSAGFLGFAPKS